MSNYRLDDTLKDDLIIHEDNPVCPHCGVTLNDWENHIPIGMMRPTRFFKEMNCWHYKCGKPIVLRVITQYSFEIGKQ